MALGIWEDLRSKRLWPVAGVLLVAVIAIPLFVIKPVEEPPAAKVEAAAPQAARTPAVVVEDASGESSNLGLFGKKDPFRPPAATLKPSSSAADAAGGSTAGPSAPPSASTGSSGSGSPPVSSGGSGGTGSKGSAPAAPPVIKRPRRAYTYVIDVDFGTKGAVRRRRGLARLAVLPSERNPVMVFLGVSTSNRAVFLLNPAQKQGGEGTCRPSKARCTFLHLSPASTKNDHYVVGPDGIAYGLKLRAIRRVTLAEARRGARAAVKRGAPSSILFADEQR